MTPLSLWRHEVRRTGWAALLTPPVCAALIGLLGVLQATGGHDDPATARTFQGVLAQGIPLAVGVVAGSLVGRDPSAELQLTVVRDYRVTLLRRLAIGFLWAAVLAVVTMAALIASGWWYELPFTPGPLLGQLVWLAPSLALAGLGFLAAAVTRNAAVASGLVAGVWLAELIMGTSGNSPLNLFARRGSDSVAWLANRAVLMGVGVLLLVAAWPVLARGERLLKGEEG